MRIVYAQSPECCDFAVVGRRSPAPLHNQETPGRDACLEGAGRVKLDSEL